MGSPFGKAIVANIIIELVIAISLLMAKSAHADVVNHSVAFNFSHSGIVSTGTASLLASYTNTVTTSSSLSLPPFDPTLGRLTKVTITVNTSTASFVISPTGLLSLLSGQSATRKLSYSMMVGATSATDSNEVISTGATLLTLLQLGGADIGGAPLAKSSQFVTAADLSAFSRGTSISINLTATNTLDVSTVLSLFNGAGMNGIGTYAGSVAVAYDYIPWTISGYVYNDIDHNGTKAPLENGTGLTLYAKLISSNNLAGPALRVAAVNPITGLYALSAVSGPYRVLIDDNATLSDVTPLQHSNWSQTQTTNLWRDVTVGGDQVNQNFGLVQATTITGRIFVDDGRQSGLANDGVINGGEIGVAGRGVRLLDNNAVILDSTVSAGDGSYRLFIPSTVANGTILQVQFANDSGYITTGMSLGNSTSVFSRQTNIVSLPFSSAIHFVGLNVGVVPVPAFNTGSKQITMPSSILFYQHHFVASSTGYITFTISHSALPETPPLNAVIYRDSNNNGKVDLLEQPISGAIPVAAGQSIALVVKVTVPSNVLANAQYKTTLTADMLFTNASPSLTYSATSTDYTEVISSQAEVLTLSKSVDQDSAAPGTTLGYTITFTNIGITPLNDVIINDQTPFNTSYLSSTIVSLPSSLSLSSISTPAVGGKGALQWSLQGELAPMTSGTIRYSVLIDN